MLRMFRRNQLLPSSISFLDRLNGSGPKAECGIHVTGLASSWETHKFLSYSLLSKVWHLFVTHDSIFPKLFSLWFRGVWDSVHLVRLPLLAYCTCHGWLWGWKILWIEDWQGKPKYSEKTCPSATSSTTNPTWPEPGSNPSRRGGRPATNRLSYGAA
jgi:hypothetical protein